MSKDNARDPYRGILDLVRGEAAGQIHSTFVVGKVLEATEAKIRIQADGHELDEQDILINAALAVAPGVPVKFQAEGPGMLDGTLRGTIPSCGFGGGHSMFAVDSFEGTITVPTLKAGDLVVLLPDDDRQYYYLICKVVPYGTVPTD